jgi:ketol-acid reductoisomerase
MPAKIYSDKHADLNVLKDKTLAVLGFGSQGHAHALNLKESGCNVIIGLYKGSKSIAVAKDKGFKVVTTAEAVNKRTSSLLLCLTLSRLLFMNLTSPQPDQG